MMRSTEWNRVHENLPTGHLFKKVHAYCGICDTLPWLQDTATEPYPEPKKFALNFPRDLTLHSPIYVCVPDGSLPFSFPTQLSMHFSSHHYLVSRPPIISSLSIFGDVQFLATAFIENDHLQGEMTALWHFTIFFLISIVGGGIKVHSTLRPLNGLLCQPRVIMIMEKSVE
jgi:hypothetical protein